MSSPLRERLAQFLYYREYQTSRDPMATFEDCVASSFWKNMLPAADAIIKFLGEPSLDQLNAAISPYVYKNTEEFNDLYRKTVREYWQRMLRS